MADNARTATCDFDLFAPQAADDPFTAYDGLRARCPVSRSSALGGYWIATGYAAVADLARDPERFSSSSISVPADAFGPDLAERPPITLDPPRHTAFRRLLLPAFSSRQIERMRPLVRAHARELLAELVPRGSCDAAADYAKPIPLRFMARMMGCPDRDEAEFAERMRGLVEASSLDEAKRGVARTREFLLELVARKRAEPGEDLVSLVLGAEDGGVRLSQAELVGALVLIITAGIDTTWSAIGSSLWHLARSPADRARLAADPDLLPTAVEEFLRAYSPVQIARVVTRGTEFYGAELTAGDSILMGIPSANRDAAQFPEPERVRLDREVNRHLAFGLGIHRCIGSAIARLELRVALGEWLAAVPEFELADPAGVSWSTGHVWGPRALPLRFGEARPCA